MNGNTQVAPVKVGETYEVSINAVGEKGDGIAKVKGFVLFVPNVQKGDYDNALEQLKIADSINPNNPDINHNIGQS